MEGATPPHQNALLTFDPYFIMLSVKQGDIKYDFFEFGMIQSGIELQSPGTISKHLNHYANRNSYLKV